VPECEDGLSPVKIGDKHFCVVEKDVSKLPLLQRIDSILIMITISAGAILYLLYLWRKN